MIKVLKAWGTIKEIQEILYRPVTRIIRIETNECRLLEYSESKQMNEYVQVLNWDFLGFPTFSGDAAKLWENHWIEENYPSSMSAALC